MCSLGTTEYSVQDLVIRLVDESDFLLGLLHYDNNVEVSSEVETGGGRPRRHVVVQEGDSGRNPIGEFWITHNDCIV